MTDSTPATAACVVPWGRMWFWRCPRCNSESGLLTARHVAEAELRYHARDCRG